MSSTEIINQLKSSAKKVAKQIASLTVEKGRHEKEYNDYENSLILLEAKIEFHKENREKYHQELQLLKETKNQYFHQRDSLIIEKRDLQRLKNERIGSSEDIETKIENVSVRIGEIIELSKSHSEKMQEIYEKSQEEHKAMIEVTNQLKDERYLSSNRQLSYKRKISEIETELNKLRRKMNTINKKLSEIEA